MPYALQPKIDKEFNNLVQKCIIEKASYSDWATPIVTVPKPKGNVRISGGFKVTVNQVVENYKYPLPQIEDILASLSQRQIISKIDLNDVYMQMEVEDSNYKGNINNVQCMIEQVMSGVPGTCTCVIMGDMILTEKTDQEHLKNWKWYFSAYW